MHGCLIESFSALCLVFTPEWFVSFMHKWFNMGFLDASASHYFDTLTESLITERRSADGADFLQTLTNNLVEAPRSDPDTAINHLGEPWTKKGSWLSIFNKTIIVTA